MQFSAIILALAAVASAATLDRRMTCQEVTDKANACREACKPSNWRCTVGCELDSSREYIDCWE